jgi:hypothetical protein
MVLKVQIGGYNIGRVFMDAGSGINLIYARNLKAMCISLESIKPTNCSFHGIVPGGANYPLEKIELDVCFMLMLLVDVEDQRSLCVVNDQPVGNPKRKV